MFSPPFVIAILHGDAFGPRCSPMVEPVVSMHVHEHRYRDDAIGPVLRLLSACSPAAILCGVVAIHVDAVD